MTAIVGGVAVLFVDRTATARHLMPEFNIFKPEHMTPIVLARAMQIAKELPPEIEVECGYNHEAMATAQQSNLTIAQIFQIIITKNESEMTTRQLIAALIGWFVVELPYAIVGSEDDSDRGTARIDLFGASWSKFEALCDDGEHLFHRLPLPGDADPPAILDPSFILCEVWHPAAQLGMAIDFSGLLERLTESDPEDELGLRKVISEQQIKAIY